MEEAGTIGSPFELQLLAEVNEARTKPTTYAEKLKEMLPFFDNNLYKDVANNVTRKTAEGAAAVNEAIDYLNKFTPVQPLTLSTAFSKSCLDLVDDNGPKGLSGNEMSDGSSAATRLGKYGEWSGKLAENICYGATTAFNIINTFIVDDGNSSRSQRNTLLDGKFHIVGLSTGPHTQYTKMCVAAFATDFKSSDPTDGEVSRGAPPQDEEKGKKAQLEESEDGKEFIIVSPSLDVTKDCVTLTKKNGDLHLIRVKKSELASDPTGKSSTSDFRYQLPIEFNANTVKATYDPSTTVVTIRIPKTSLGTQASNSADITEFKLDPVSTAAESRISLDVTEDKDHYIFKVKGGTQYEQIVRVKLQEEGFKVVVESEHDEVSKDESGDKIIKTFTRTESVRLPVAVRSADFLTTNLERQGVDFKFRKPSLTSSDDPNQELSIPIV